MLSRLLLARSIKNHSSNDNSWNDFMGLLAPIAWYKLNEASGPDAVDSSGNGRTATYPGSGVTYNQPSGMSNIGNGVTHTVGTPSPTQRAYDPAFGITGDVTILAVTKIAATHTTYPIIVTQPSDTTLSGRSTFLLHQDYGSLNGKFTFRINVGGAYNDVSSSTIPVVGDAYLVVGRRKGTDLSIFVNGVKENTLSGISGLADTAAYPLYIGGTVENTSGNGSVISNVAIFNRALYDEDIIALYSAANGALGDPYWDSVLALMHFDGVDGSKVFTDEKTHTVNVMGAAKLSTTKYKFGPSSAYFDGSNGTYAEMVVGAEAVIGTQDFTIEMFISPLSVGGAARSLLYKYVSWASNIDFALRISTGGKLQFLAGPSSAGTPNIFVTGTTNIITNVWQHVAICRAGGTLRMFINGVLDYSGAAAASIAGNSSLLRLGSFDRSATEVYNGYLDDLRITIGAARYVTNFTPPTAPFPNHK